jgi:hypothetical protein
MTTQGSAAAALVLQQLAHERAFRRWSNLSLAWEMLAAVGLLAVLGVLLSIGFAALEPMAVR